MTGPGRVSIPAQDQGLDLGETKVRDLIGPDVEITWDGVNGTVVGPIKKVSAWPEWGAPDGGHFFPVTLAKQYTGKPVTCEGTVKRTETDLTWVIKVDEAKAAEKKFTFTVDGETVVTLDFSKATLS